MNIAPATLILLLFASSVIAQTAYTPGGPYSQLSPGNQQIVRALYQSQTTNNPNTPPLTLDQIATMKTSGQQGWGRVFHTLRAEGRIDAKNLGQVVSSYERHANSTGTITSAANRTENVADNTHGSTSHGGRVDSRDTHGVSGGHGSGAGSTVSGGGSLGARGGGAAHSGGK